MFLWSDCVPGDDPLGWLQLSVHPCVSFYRLLVSQGMLLPQCNPKMGQGFCMAFY